MFLQPANRVIPNYAVYLQLTFSLSEGKAKISQSTRQAVDVRLKKDLRL